MEILVTDDDMALQRMVRHVLEKEGHAVRVADHAEAEVLSIAGRDVRVTHPDKPYFTKEVRLTKLDVVKYYLSVADGALRGIRDRPIVLKRFVNGAEAPPFYQKRAPEGRPEQWESHPTKG